MEINLINIQGFGISVNFQINTLHGDEEGVKKKGIERSGGNLLSHLGRFSREGKRKKGR